MSTSKPISRDSIHDGLHPVPPPLGCAECKIDRAGRWSWPCGHSKHFRDIRWELERRGNRFLGAGSYRATYESKNKRWVYKVPLEASGYQDNYFESLAWKERKNLYSGSVWIGERVARCRMLPNGVLVMERMKHAGSHGYESWQADQTLQGTAMNEALGQIDGCQGGIARDGSFRLYDYTHWIHIKDPVTPGMWAL